ncbi:hypothetical protein QFZ54_003127 [Sphingomonas faeni]|nr:hypothetical protein [Sphingomonas faeni]MDQ0839343.1 hypothetical protein [Sphingomonas faeni]
MLLDPADCYAFLDCYLFLSSTIDPEPTEYHGRSPAETVELTINRVQFLPCNQHTLGTGFSFESTVEGSVTLDPAIFAVTAVQPCATVVGDQVNCHSAQEGLGLTDFSRRLGSGVRLPRLHPQFLENVLGVVTRSPGTNETEQASVVGNNERFQGITPRGVN